MPTPARLRKSPPLDVGDDAALDLGIAHRVSLTSASETTPVPAMVNATATLPLRCGLMLSWVS